MWVVQVGNGTNGVKNLFVVRGKKKMESTAADSLVIVCFVEVSQSCREKRPCGAHLTFQRGVGWMGMQWAGLGAGRAGDRQPVLTGNQGPPIAQICI